VVVPCGHEREIGGRARDGSGGGGVAFSWVVQGRLTDNASTPLFFVKHS
jgi:hypothetical protein